jgi:polyisoprenoid-binding protein YceI
MKRLSFFIGALFMASALLAQNVQLDTEKSRIEWLGKKVTGEHTGEISFKSGKLSFDGSVLTGGNFEVDMHSITCTDLTNEEYNQKLVGHLKSDDFFGVEKFPTSTLSLTAVRKTADKEYLAKGKLTIKGKSNPVEFKVSQNGKVFEGAMVIDRSLYDVKYGSGKFFDNLGDKMIYDDFTLSFRVQAL